MHERHARRCLGAGDFLCDAARRFLDRGSVNVKHARNSCHAWEPFSAIAIMHPHICHQELSMKKIMVISLAILAVSTSGALAKKISEAESSRSRDHKPGEFISAYVWPSECC